ncbi:MAG: dihydropteroate synthase [Planctomycetaceae bacterium]|nr:dihydropteroate synthase [Planctomycetaceae bacterium]
MGILNVTPDSFSDGGNYVSVTAAVEHGLQLADGGADIIDLGGESTRPGAEVVPLEEELRRTIPVIEALSARVSIPISIDTTKSEVARQAIAAGASIVNDISGLTFDPEMISVCAAADVGVCLMHIQGTPQTMQQEPQYQDVLGEVCDWLRRRVEVCVTAGIARERICVDPGIGFGKTFAHNVTLLRSTAELRRHTGCPVLIGHSRKRFLGKLLGRNLDERTAGTVGVSIALAEQGVEVLRVHDVQGVRDALIAWNAIQNPAADLTGG